MLGSTTFPRLFRVFKPDSRLKAGEVPTSQPRRAIELLEERLALGFGFTVVLADRLSGESGEFIGAWHRHHRQDGVAIRSHQGVWMRPAQRLRRTRWRPFDRRFTEGTSHERFIRQTIFGTRQPVRFFQITTDPETLPPETTGDLMTNPPGTIERTVGNTFGWRTGIEYGFKPAKEDLGWADYRVTDSSSLERWWELVRSAYPLVSRQSPDLAQLGHLAPAPQPPAAPDGPAPRPTLQAHPAWETGSGWKQHLNHLRRLLQPYVCSCLLLPWLALVPLPHVQAVQTGLAALGSFVDTFRLALPT